MPPGLSKRRSDYMSCCAPGASGRTLQLEVCAASRETERLEGLLLSSLVQALMQALSTLSHEKRLWRVVCGDAALQRPLIADSSSLKHQLVKPQDQQIFALQ